MSSLAVFRPLRFQPQQFLRVAIRHVSSDSPVFPPLLTKMKSDLKDAMKAKDTIRRDSLRAIISEVDYASKTTQPVKTDFALLSLLQRRADLLEAAKKEYTAASRQDLIADAETESKILQEYALQIPVMSEGETQKAVDEIVQKIRASGQQPTMKSIMAVAYGSEGVLVGKPIFKKIVVQMAVKATKTEKKRPSSMASGQ
ncbi:hypothetical protein FQN57_001846 [Myotisia sp. PD_48]|nr:hypothetical protein FQN57_001846 [Myotisia sp. PD_48]